MTMRAELMRCVSTQARTKMAKWMALRASQPRRYSLGGEGIG